MKVYYTCDVYIILTLQQDNWLAASTDSLVLDCSDYDNPCGLMEIKCPARARKVSLVDLCTKPELKPSSFFAIRRREIPSEEYPQLLLSSPRAVVHYQLALV